MEIKNLQVEKWYKSKAGNYFKFKKLKNNIFYSSEEIINKEWRRGGARWLGGLGGIEELVEVPIYEIQKYLPESHIDKIVKQENQIPEYVELLPNFDNKYTGKIFNIKKDSQPLGWGYESWEWLIQDVHKKYFKSSTKSAYETQFKKKEPIEDLLAEAKKKYPAGTKYICPFSNKQFVLNITYNTYTLTSNNNIDAGLGRGYLYYNGKWAEVISLPEKSEISWHEEQHQIVEKLYMPGINFYGKKQPELFKKNKVISVEVLPLQKPYLISTKKKKSKLIFN